MTCFGVMLVLTFAAVLGGVKSIGELRLVFDETADKTAKKIELVGKINEAKSEMLRAQRGLIMFAFANLPAKEETTRKEFQTGLGKLRLNLAEFVPLIVRPEGKVQVERIQSALASWIPKYEELDRMCRDGKPADAVPVTVAVATGEFVVIAKATDVLIRLQQETLSENRQMATGQYKLSLVGGFSLLGLALVAGIAVFWVIRRTNDSLRRVAAEMGDGAGEVSSAAGQVAQSSQSLAQAASEQAASLEETSASTEQITSMTRKNADNSRSAAELSGQTAQLVTIANDNLEQMVGSMHEINASSGIDLENHQGY